MLHNPGGQRPNRPIFSEQNPKNELLERIAHESTLEYKAAARLDVLRVYLEQRVSFISHPYATSNVSGWVTDKMNKTLLKDTSPFGRPIDREVFPEIGTQVTTVFDGRKFVFVIGSYQSEPTPTDGNADPSAARQQTAGHLRWSDVFAISRQYDGRSRRTDALDFFNDVVSQLLSIRLNGGANHEDYALLSTGWTLSTAYDAMDDRVLVVMA